MKKIALSMIFLIFLLDGCGILTSDKNNLLQMDNHIIYAFKKKKEVTFYDKEEIRYPKVNTDKSYMKLGDGILFYKINNFIVKQKIPKGKKARVFIQTNDELLYRDLAKSLSRFKSIVIAKKDNVIDFYIVALKYDKQKISLSIRKGYTPLKNYKDINIENLEHFVNNDAYVNLLVGNNLYKIRQDTINLNIYGIKKSLKNLSFNEANSYCIEKEDAILPKLYIFEKALRLGYLKPPIGSTKEFISGYFVKNIRGKDILPDDEMSIIIYDWGSQKYFSYPKGFKKDKEKFKDVAFRCMKME